MGGALKKIRKGVKKVWKGTVGKVVGGVVKRIKKVGKKVWEGAKNLLGKVGEFTGKLGPIGTIALSMMLPGIGTAISTAWGNAAGWLSSQGGLMQAVGQGMKHISTAGNYFSKGFSKVTDSISRGLTEIGGNIVDGTDHLIKGAQEFVGVKDPSGIRDAGKWIADKAKSFTSAKPAPTTPAQPNGIPLANADPQQARSLFPGLEDAMTQSTIEPGTSPLVSSMEAQAAEQAGLQAGRLEQMFPTVQDPLSPGIAQSLPQASSGPGVKDVLKEGAKSLAGSLLGQPSPDQGFQPFRATPAQAVGGTRGAIGGTGAGGGQFLSQQQLAAIQAFNKQLEELG